MPRTLIADDEPLLRDALVRGLAIAWPELEIAALATSGDEALALALQTQPDVCFLDIRMPGMSGLDAALALADEWPSAGDFPLIVFITAHDEYALKAFDAQACDYVLKPVAPERLARCVQRLKDRLRARLALQTAAAADPMQAVAQSLAQLRQALVPSPAAQPRLHLLQAGLGTSLHMVAVSDVIVVEASDRYLRVLTADAEHLLRMPLHELRARLDPAEFWQIHRSVLVRVTAMKKLEREESGKLKLHLRGRAEVWPVGRVYAAQFVAM